MRGLDCASNSVELTVSDTSTPAGPSQRGLLRRIARGVARAAWRVVRPVARPVLHGMRGFFTADLAQTLSDVRADLDDARHQQTWLRRDVAAAQQAVADAQQGLTVRLSELAATQQALAAQVSELVAVQRSLAREIAQMAHAQAALGDEQTALGRAVEDILVTLALPDAGEIGQGRNAGAANPPGTTPRGRMLS